MKTEWKECAVPYEEGSCDGEWHYYLLWDEDTQRAIEQQATCPHWDSNNKILSVIDRTIGMYYRFKDSDIEYLGAESASVSAAASCDVIDPKSLFEGEFNEEAFDRAVEQEIERTLLKEFFG